MTSRSVNELDPKEYAVDNLHLTDNHKCTHKFIREDDRVECMFCHVGYMDPKGDFPLEELNSLYDQEDTKEYFSTRSP